MKSLLRSLVMLLAVSFSMTAFANTNPTVDLVEDKKFVLNLNEWVKSDVNVTITQMSGEILHSDRFTSNSKASKKYNLENLADGTYELNIASDDKKAIYVLEVVNGSVAVNMNEKSLVFESTVKVDDQFIYFNQLALGRDVSVFLSNGSETLFSKDYKDNMSISKVYDISKLPSADYIFFVEGKDQFEKHVFSK